jgi:hypothetical protein
MLADDFGFRIALEAVCAGIPARYGAIRIQHIDGVVGHRLDPEAVAPVFSQGTDKPARRGRLWHQKSFPAPPRSTSSQRENNGARLMILGPCSPSVASIGENANRYRKSKNYAKN